VGTITAILLTDLLKGITIGILLGIFYTLRHSYRNSHHLKISESDKNGQHIYHIVLAEEVSFFNKPNLMKSLDQIPENTKVIIDFSKCKSVAYDVVELVKNYQQGAISKNIEVEKISFLEK
jgi:SulP family sulfate permease